MLMGGVKRALSSGLSSRGSGSCSGDNGSQDSSWSSSFMPSPHGTVGLSHYLAHDDVPEATDNDDISIYTTEEMNKYESLYHREFAHPPVYDVNLLERVGLDEELPTILRIIGWGKLYDERRLVLHYSLFRWDRHAIASQDHLALVGKLAWRQHSRPRLHHRLTLRRPSDTLGMGVATQLTMRVVVTTPLTVTSSLASKPEPSPLPGTPLVHSFGAVHQLWG
jgi:hypothetical protein